VVRREAEQLGEQDRLIARRAGTAKPEEAAEAVAVGAALLTKVLLAAGVALEEPVGKQIGAAFELGDQRCRVGDGEVDLAEAVGALPTRIRAEASATRWQAGPADGAAWLGASGGL